MLQRRGRLRRRARGTTVQLPLELLNPDKGIGIQASLRVPIGSVGGAARRLGSTTSGLGTTGANDAPVERQRMRSTAPRRAAPPARARPARAPPTTTLPPSRSTSNGTRDLVPFTFGRQSSTRNTASARTRPPTTFPTWVASRARSRSPTSRASPAPAACRTSWRPPRPSAPMARATSGHRQHAGALGRHVPPLPAADAAPPRPSSMTS